MVMYVITDDDVVIGVTGDYIKAMKVKEKLSSAEIKIADTDDVTLMCEGYKEYGIMQEFDGNCVVRWKDSIITYGTFDRPWEIKGDNSFKCGVRIRAKSEEDAIAKAEKAFRNFEYQQQMKSSWKRNKQLDKLFRLNRATATDINEVL